MATPSSGGGAGGAFKFDAGNALGVELAIHEEFDAELLRNGFVGVDEPAAFVSDDSRFIQARDHSGPVTATYGTATDAAKSAGMVYDFEAIGGVGWAISARRVVSTPAIRALVTAMDAGADCRGSHVGSAPSSLIVAAGARALAGDLPSGQLA